MNFLEALRLKQFSDYNDPYGQKIKNVTFPVTPLKPTPKSPLNPPDVDDYKDPLESLRAKPTPRLKDYESYLESQPKRKDYQLSRIGKVLAAVAGGAEGWDKGPTAGVSTFTALKDRPYAEAHEEWQGKGERLKELAGIERQNLSDEERRIIQSEEFKQKNADQARQWMLANSTMDLNEARRAELKDRVEDRRWSWQRNELDGQLYRVNIKTGETQSIMQVMKSWEQEKGWEREKYGMEQQGRVDLQAQAHRNAMSLAATNATRNLKNDKDLAKFRADLDAEISNHSPAAQNAALEGAFKETMMSNPELRDIVYMPNGDMKVGTNNEHKKQIDDAYRLLIEKTKIMRNRRLGVPPTQSGFSSITPTETDPTVLNLRVQAMRFLKDQGFDENDEENIQLTMTRLQEEAAKTAPTTPSPQGPQSSIMPQITPPATGMAGMQSVFTEPTKFTSPQFPTGGPPPNPYAAAQQAAGWFSNIPKRIYGTPPGRDPRNELR